jgi:hypothetical protein
MSSTIGAKKIKTNQKKRRKIMIGKILAGFILTMIVCLGGGAYIMGQVPDNIWIYIVGFVVFMVITNFIGSILTNEPDYTAEYEALKNTPLEIKITNAPDIKGVYVEGGGGRLALRQSKDNQHIDIYDVSSSGRISSSSTRVSRKEAAKVVSEKLKRSKNEHIDHNGTYWGGDWQ